VQVVLLWAYIVWYQNEPDSVRTAQ